MSANYFLTEDLWDLSDCRERRQLQYEHLFKVCIVDSQGPMNTSYKWVKEILVGNQPLLLFLCVCSVFVSDSLRYGKFQLWEVPVIRVTLLFSFCLRSLLVEVTIFSFRISTKLCIMMLLSELLSLGGGVTQVFAAKKVWSYHKTPAFWMEFGS